MKLFFALASITFFNALSMDHHVVGTEQIIYERLVDSEWLDGDAGKLSMYFKTWRIGTEEAIHTDGVIQISGSKKQFLFLLNLRQLKNQTPTTLCALVRTFRWIKGELTGIAKSDFSLFPNVEEIDLHSNNIELVDPEAFRSLPKLKKVLLDNNQLSQEMIAHLKQNLAHLEILDCRGQRTPPASSQALRGLLTRVASHVTTLSIAGKKGDKASPPKKMKLIDTQDY